MRVSLIASTNYRNNRQKVKLVIVHEEYNETRCSTNECNIVRNDVAVLVLNYPLDFNDPVHAIPLLERDSIPSIKGESSHVQVSSIQFLLSWVHVACVFLLLWMGSHWARIRCPFYYEDIVEGTSTRHAKYRMLEANCRTSQFDTWCSTEPGEQCTFPWYDIALLVLNYPLTFNELVRSIPLLEPHHIPSTKGKLFRNQVSFPPANSLHFTISLFHAISSQMMAKFALGESRLSIRLPRLCRRRKCTSVEVNNAGRKLSSL